VLRYVVGTLGLGLQFGGKTKGVRGYCNADYAGDLDSRKSTTAHVWLIHGGAVSWRSVLQTTVALSTAGAEYRFIERDGRKGPPAGNKAKCNRTNTPHSKATQRKAKPNQTTQNPHTGRETGLNRLNKWPQQVQLGERCGCARSFGGS
jgi:hypothetical protein